MNASLPSLRLPSAILAAWICSTGACWAQAAPADPAPRAASEPAKPADATKAPDRGKAAEACESAVTDNLRELRGRDGQRVEFIGTQRALSPAQGDEISVKGAGRYSGGPGGAIPFTYGCTYNAKSGTTNGVVISDKGASQRAPEKTFQPDLSKLSPEVCETAVAAFLKDKYPRVGRIAFGSDSRQLKAATADRTSLEGRGGLERAPGMHSIPFSYRCEFENRSGKLVSAKASES